MVYNCYNELNHTLKRKCIEKVYSFWWSVIQDEKCIFWITSEILNSLLNQLTDLKTVYSLIILRDKPWKMNYTTEVKNVWRPRLFKLCPN